MDLDLYNGNHGQKDVPTVTADHAAVTRIRTWVTSATTKGTNHYTITTTGTDENTSSFLRNLFLTLYIFVSTASIFYHKREVEVQVGVLP